MASGDALDLAIAAYRDPSRMPELRDRPLPDDVQLVLRLAANDRSALELARERTSDHGELQEAAIFFLQQILFSPNADAYRILGATSDAEQSYLRENYRWLIKWLHPDRNADMWESVYADKVNVAWQALKTPDRRARYDAEEGVVERQRPDTVGPATGLVRHTSKPPVIPPAGRKALLSGNTVRYLPAITLSVMGLGASVLLGLMYWVNAEHSRPPVARSDALAVRVEPQISTDSQLAGSVTEAGSSSIDLQPVLQPNEPEEIAYVVDQPPIALEPTEASDQPVAVEAEQSVTVVSAVADSLAPDSVLSEPVTSDSSANDVTAKAAIAQLTYAVKEVIDGVQAPQSIDAMEPVDGVSAEPAAFAQSAMSPPLIPEPEPRTLAANGGSDRTPLPPTTDASPPVTSSATVAKAATPATIVRTAPGTERIRTDDPVASVGTVRPNAEAATMTPPRPLPLAPSAVATTASAEIKPVAKTAVAQTTESAAVGQPTDSPLRLIAATVPSATVPSATLPSSSASTAQSPPSLPSGEASGVATAPAPRAIPPSASQAAQVVQEFASAYTAGNLPLFDQLFSGRVVDHNGVAGMRTRIQAAQMRYLEIADVRWELGTESAVGVAEYRETFVPIGERKAVTKAGSVQWEIRMDGNQARIAAIDVQSAPN